MKAKAHAGSAARMLELCREGWERCPSLPLAFGLLSRGQPQTRAQSHRYTLAVWLMHRWGPECTVRHVHAPAVPSEILTPSPFYQLMVSQSILVMHPAERHRPGTVFLFIKLFMCQMATQTPGLVPGKVYSKLQSSPGKSLHSESFRGGWERGTQRHTCLRSALVSTHSSTAIWRLMSR